MKKTSDKASSVNIIEVFSDNFISEIKRISSYLEEYNYIGMDTEFPGIVYGINNITQDFYYKAMKLNVDSLKLIQLGITLCNEKGEYPPEASTWQFNLKFDYEKDKFAASSFAMLCNCGIDFDKLKKKGIEHKLFAEYLTISGLVLNPDVHWISFHGSYDFAYMLRLLINQDLPTTEGEFTNTLIEYFPSHYDIRILVQGKDNLKGGLNRLAQYLEILRVGKTHQAGSDSFVTAEVFFKLLQSKLIEKDTIETEQNILFGLGVGADDNETITYTKFNSPINGPSVPSSLNGSSNGTSNFNYMINSNSTLNGNTNQIQSKTNLSMNMMYQPFQQYGYGYGMKIPLTNGTNPVTQNGKKMSNASIGFTS